MNSGSRGSTPQSKKRVDVCYLLSVCCLVLSAALSASCGGGGSNGGGGGSTPHVKRAPTLIGYSLVNAWHLTDPEAFADELASNGLTATEIEWAPLHGSPIVCAGSTEATYPVEALAFVRAMRKQSITTYINVVNANGCGETRQSTAWFQAQLDVIKSFGIDGIILGGVSEPWALNDGKLHAWEKMASDQWNGFFIAPTNGASDRPYWADIGYDYLDSHPCSQPALSNLLGKGNTSLLPNTDCGLMLNPGPQGAKVWVQEALDTGSNLLIYDFHGLTPDVATINSMGEVIQTH